jgi:hypothetical protein
MSKNDIHAEIKVICNKNFKARGLFGHIGPGSILAKNREIV